LGATVVVLVEAMEFATSVYPTYRIVRVLASITLHNAYHLQCPAIAKDLSASSLSFCVNPSQQFRLAVDIGTAAAFDLPFLLVVVVEGPAPGDEVGNGR
jgi:hypothetical protein